MPARRVRSPTPAAPSGARAKALRPLERTRRALRDETRRALGAFEEAARDYERFRKVGEPADPRCVRRAAATLMDALLCEVEQRTDALPPELAADVEKWADGAFTGTEVDVEIANHALWALLDSAVVAELPVNDV